MVQKTKRMRGVLSALLSLVLVAGLLPVMPTSALAVDTSSDLGSVRVIVENTTFTAPGKEGGSAPAWTGTLVDTNIALSSDSTMTNCVKRAVEGANYTLTISSTGYGGYIRTIHGLSEHDGDDCDPKNNDCSGWMGTLNDWFTNTGFDNYSVENGKLSAGDEIRVMYTVTGQDLGNPWYPDDMTLKSVDFSAGTLDEEFSPNNYSYTLFVPVDTTAITIAPTATNKNFQVRMYSGTTQYKRTESIPVSNGTIVKVFCGSPSWSSMEDSDDACIYTFKIVGGPAATRGDINNNNAINIVDAQIVYDMVAGFYGADYSALKRPSDWNQATFEWVVDANSDGKLDAADALAIQYYALYGSWGTEQ